MTEVIAVNTVHAGSGVSTIVANMAALLAAETPGLRVGVVDACLTAPTQHLLFGLRQAAFRFTLNDHLLGHCSLADAVHTIAFDSGAPGARSLYLIPANPDPAAVARADHRSYDVDELGERCRQLAADLALDILLIDTEAGLPPSTLACFSAASMALLVLALDKQHYQGTARTVAVVDHLPVARREIMVNLTSPSLNFASVQAQVTQSYGWQLAAIIPYCDELLALGSASLFALQHPAHAVTELLRQVARGLAGRD